MNGHTSVVFSRFSKKVKKHEASHVLQPEERMADRAGTLVPELPWTGQELKFIWETCGNSVPVVGNERHGLRKRKGVNWGWLKV